MWHVILAGLMLACAVATTLFAGDALEQSQSRTEPAFPAETPIGVAH